MLQPPINSFRALSVLNLPTTKEEVPRRRLFCQTPKPLAVCRFKEAVNECTNAMEIDGVYAKALIRRAKAHEAMGHYKQALSDIQKANKADSANPDTQV